MLANSKPAKRTASGQVGLEISHPRYFATRFFLEGAHVSGLPFAADRSSPKLQKALSYNPVRGLAAEKIEAANCLVWPDWARLGN